MLEKNEQQELADENQRSMPLSAEIGKREVVACEKKLSGRGIEINAEKQVMATRIKNRVNSWSRTQIKSHLRRDGAYLLTYFTLNI